MVIQPITIHSYAAMENANVTVVEIRGQLDSITALQVEKYLNRLLDQKKFRIVIDLKEVSYISSAGWGIFIGILKEIKINSGDLKLSGLNDDVREVFQLLEIDFILPTFGSNSDAIAAFL
ncbi:STAS domain-containing protein [bacterium]|nr:STAS domain-containing protein [bacterium]